MHWWPRMPTVCCAKSTNNSTAPLEIKTLILFRWPSFPEVPIHIWSLACKRQVKNSGWLPGVLACLAINVVEPATPGEAHRQPWDWWQSLCLTGEVGIPSSYLILVKSQVNEISDHLVIGPQTASAPSLYGKLRAMQTPTEFTWH